MRWLSCIAALAAVVYQVAGQDIPTPTNRTDDANIAGLSNAFLTLSNNATAGEWTLLLATPPQPLNRTVSTLFNVNTANLTASPTNALLMVSCDPSSYPGSLTLAGTLGLLAQSHPTAIIFYSLSSAFCNPPRNSSLVPWFSVVNSNQNNGAALLSQANSSPSVVIVAGNGSVPNTTSGNGTDPGPYAWVSGTATTAVAMIILYSITGIITALFLLIIVTGAVRAHRHPERYGLRNAVGQPRQSRARGIARAMLETLPIVKFGDTQPQPKTVDVELQAADQHSTVPTKDAPPSTSTASDPQPTVPPPAAAAAAAPAANEEDPMCSICTEEFERGQDTRVLPCRHKFHPACVDPWLLDVSGTCPLCRMDLRDQDSGASTDEQQQQQQQQPANGLAPPLDPAAPGGPASTSGGRLHALLRRLQPTTAEERIQALRRFREENMHDATAAAEHETRWQRARRRLRL